MNGRDNSKIKDERLKIIGVLKDKYGDDVEILESFFENAPYDAKPLWFLGKSFELLSEADKAFFANDWSLSRGCEMEHNACVKYGIEIIND
jgi:hypothetical protein